MVRDDVIFLVNAEGNERQVFCRVESVKMTEAYTAKAYGLNPTVVFVLSDFIDYEGEELCRWGETYYSIIRTYSVDKARYNRVSGREIELVCEKKAFFGPHTVTVYNVREDPATFERSVQITILPGVFLSGTTGADASVPAMRPTDTAQLQIPFSVNAKDAITGAARTYAPARAFSLAEDKSGLWTLDVNHDFFVKGTVIEPTGVLQTLRASTDDLFMVRAVSEIDTGLALMHHWEVSGSKWRFTYT